jgi:hypothetical protein
MIEKKEKSGHFIYALRKRIKYLKANNPGNETPELLKLQDLINVLEKDKG